MALKAGRELDRIVAEKVFGTKTKTVSGYSIQTDVDRGLQHLNEDDQHIPPYSTDIAAAWSVVEKLGSNGLTLALESSPEWTEAIFEEGHSANDALSHPGVVDADTAPHAICLAALRAVGVDAPSESR